MTIHLVHRKRLDAVLPQDHPLARIDIAQSDVDEALGVEQGFDPGEFRDLFSGSQRGEEEGAQGRDDEDKSAVG